MAAATSWARQPCSCGPFRIHGQKHQVLIATADQNQQHAEGNAGPQQFYRAGCEQIAEQEAVEVHVAIEGLDQQDP
jgi:hypothetical protein